MKLPIGVYKAKKKDGSIYYRSSFTYKNKHISLGSYPTAGEAHQCYQSARYLAEHPQFTVGHFTTSQPLSFDKWVILCNFRDNNLYFPTPIYLHKTFLSYYISLDEILIFDVDDLFYYGNHKIHKRGGYYFVNDYGIQTNILSRYGIHPHGVPGRDYQFIDGDPNNLRYDNVQVINPYHGVFENRKKGRTLYEVRLNINGAWKVGTYGNITNAAIAYNKAIDLVHAHGLSSKDFPKNFLVDLNSRQYWSIYHDIYLENPLLSSLIPKIEDYGWDQTFKT